MSKQTNDKDDAIAAAVEFLNSLTDKEQVELGRKLSNIYQGAFEANQQTAIMVLMGYIISLSYSGKMK